MRKLYKINMKISDNFLLALSEVLNEENISMNASSNSTEKNVKFLKNFLKLKFYRKLVKKN